MKKLYLIDVSSLFFRAFYAIRQLNNSKGLPTNALYGFLAAVIKILREHKPDAIAFCYDSPEGGFREELYEDYKANRTDPPDDLAKQFPYMSKVGEALSIAGFRIPGFEADDLIGTLTVKNQGRDCEVIIVSGDKDFAQLVKPGVRIFDPAKDIYIDDDGVRAKFGVSPNQIIDYLSLVGDSSDNVPGVRGIGPKGAQKLLGEFGTLDGIYENLDKIKNDRLRELLRGSKKDAYMSQKLVTIRTDCELKDSSLKDLTTKPVNRDLLVPLLEEFEFKTLLQRLLGESSAGAKSGTKQEAMASTSATSTSNATVSVSAIPLNPGELVVTAEVGTLDKALAQIKDSEVWVDITSGGIGLQMGGKVFRFEGESASLTRWLDKVLQARPRVKISGYDTKTFAHQLKLDPASFQSVGTDVLLQAYCTGRGGSYEFNDLVSTHLGKGLAEFARPEERLYAIRRVSQKLNEDLSEGQRKILKEIEEPLVPVLYRMEKTGVMIDVERLGVLSKELSREAQSLEKEICAAAGYDFNVGSPKQLGQVLFDKLKLPVARKTKTGYSTDSDVLEKLKDKHPIAEKILEWRELTKLRSTYVDALPPLVDSETGRIHTQYNQAVAVTGRLSSVHPNLQNIPIRTKRGQMIRECFVAPHGEVLVSADYSQVELRILAHITGDQALKRAFEEDRDIHSATAAEVFGVRFDEVTPEHRRVAKMINFGIAYGMSDFGLAERLGLERSKASDFIARYFKRFPGVQHYMHDIVETGKRQSYVETLFGRRAYYTGINSSNGRLRQMAERQVINMPIQGAAADIIKMAMLSIPEGLKSFGENCMLLQVHDELVFQTDSDQAGELGKRVQKIMENAVKLSVPIKASVGTGKNWGEAH